MRPVVTLLITLSVFATGAAGLIYEVVWQRYLVRLIGNDHVATALTLAVFLAGLSLGYALCGRLTTVVRDHLRTYALLEALIGLWAVAFPWTFAAVEHLTGSWSFRAPLLLLFQGVLVASLLLLIPTMLMGATVPFLTRIAAGAAQELTSVHAFVYGANTAGAFAGALLAGFWMVPAYGLPGTLVRASVANLATAALFLLLTFGGRRRVALAGVTRSERLATVRFPAALLCGIALLSGVETMVLENALFRFASIVLGSSTHTFAMVVAVFVAAIALGSLVVSRLRRLPPWLLCVNQLAVATSLLAIWLTLDEWPYYLHVLRLGFGTTAVAFYLYHAAVLGILGALFLVPVALMGATLPIVFHEIRPAPETAGYSSGRLLSWNAAGNLVGSLAGGFLLYYLLDAPQVFLIAPLLAAVAAALTAGPLHRAMRPLTFVAITGVLVVLVFQPTFKASRLVIGTHQFREALPYSFEGADAFDEAFYRWRRIVSREDGPFGSVAIVETPLPPDGGKGPLSLYVNGKSESNTELDGETLRLAAHLPALWADERDRVLVVGLGTGVTAGELTLYPDVERIDVAEISPAVVRALPHFGPYNRNLHEDPRFAVHREDARLLLRRHPARWNVIISEPSNLWVSGIDLLFSRSFYRSVGEALAEDGLFLQWVHLYDADVEMIGIVAHTLKSEFPTVHAFRGTSRDLLLLASRRPFRHEDRLRAESIYEQLFEVHETLAEIGIQSVDDILDREVATFSMLFDRPRGYEIHVLDRPRLPYLASLAAFSGSVVDEEQLRSGSDPPETRDELDPRPQRSETGPNLFE